MDWFASFCIAWAQKDVRQAASDELVTHKMPILLRWPTDMALGCVAQDDPPLCSNVVDNFLMPLCRVVAADHRELWELLDHPDRIPQRAQHRISLWNEQQALKKAHAVFTLRRRQSQASSDDAGGAGSQVGGTSPGNQDGQQEAMHEAALAAYFYGTTLLTIKPYPTGESAVQEAKRMEGSGNAPPLGADAGQSNVFVVPMQYDGDDDDCHGAENAPPQRPHADCLDGWHHGEGNQALEVLGEGSLHCARTLPPFSPLLTIPRSEMFMIASLAGRCAFYDAMEAAGPAARAAFPDDETKLILCLVFERFFMGPADSHWAQLLAGCPRCYPSVPTFWGMHELAELEGNNMIDEVLAKKSALEEFHAASAAAIDALALVDTVATILKARCTEPSASLLAERFRQTWRLSVFTHANLHWARATFDSRAFNLNVDGQVVLALVPTADMINHDVRSDVLMRHVGPDNGPFVLTTGAALTASDVGRELWMSYGPLQSWELVMSYGFVLGDDNENDRIPFPIALEQDSDDADVYTQRRWALIRANGLGVGHEWWIGSSGVPCPALLAMLRLQLAEIEHFPLLEAGSVFDSVDAQLERRVVATVRMAHAAIEGEFSTTLEEDEAMLRDDASNANDGRDDEGEGSDDSGDAPLSTNARMAVRLRVGIKKILKRVDLWCTAQEQHQD